MKHSIRRRRVRNEVSLGFQIAPMIDVVFVILLFFMVAAGQAQVEKSHVTALPSYPGPVTPIVLPDEVIIFIGQDGQVYLNEEPMDAPAQKDLRELAEEMKKLKQAGDSMGAKLLVTIQSEPLAKYERVVDVLDALTRANVSNVTFMAEESTD